MKIEELHHYILQALPDAEIFLRDLTGGGDHFEAFVVSSSFEGQSLIRRHQTVMNALQEPLKGPLHALSLKTYTPSDWEEAQKKGDLL